MIGRGLYKIREFKLGQDFDWEDLALTAMSVLSGIIYLIPALC